MTRPSDLDAPVRPADGPLLLRALVLVGLVVGALLLALGPPRGAGVVGGGDRIARVQASAAITGSDAVHRPGDLVAPAVAEADGWADEPASAEPLPDLPRPVSGTGFRPRRHDLVPAWTSTPPDRPPRYA